MKFSIVIPAHNEERFIGGCLDSVERAAERVEHGVEVIVVANRCNDGTASVAHARGASVVPDENRSLAKTRNAGARHATGDILVTIDADSRMTENMLVEIARALESGRYIGGGVSIRPDRWSAGIAASYLFLRSALLLSGLCGGLFWCCRRDFEAIGGFNEALLVAEDLDFAKRLRTHGRTQGKRLTTLRKAHIVTSCRKFDVFGDWHLFRLLLFHGRELRQALSGEDRTFADRHFYDFNG